MIPTNQDLIVYSQVIKKKKTQTLTVLSSDKLLMYVCKVSFRVVWQEIGGNADPTIRDI